MDYATLRAFVDELTEIQKLAGRGIGELLTAKAVRRGLDPTKIPAITQVGNIAQAGNRSRAAEVAKNVSGFIRQAA